MTILPLLLALSPFLRAQETPPLAPPGRLIDLGGWRLHLTCSGEAKPGQPAVILEAGAGDFSVDWSLVQPGVAQFARVCSYDRAGSGWSDLGPRPRTLHQIVWELHTLLDKATMKSPYVLVGHSYGGWIVRLYASTYPNEIAGMVLVEAGADNPQRLTADRKVVRASDLAKGEPVPPVKTSGPLHEADIPPRIVALIQDGIKDAAPHANDPPRDKLPPDAQRMRAWTVSQVKHSASNDNPVEAEELTALYEDRKRKEHPLGNMPLIVLSRGMAEDKPAAEEEHSKDQAVLVTLSTAGRQIIAKRSGHHIPLDEPDLVVRAIREIVSPTPRTPVP
jgi:pimeloyl-ACP methyl ester carboxylesterase